MLHTGIDRESDGPPAVAVTARRVTSPGATDESAATRPLDGDARSLATANLSALLGLDARVAALAIAVDLVLTGFDAATLGAATPLGVAAAVGLGAAVYRMQVERRGDGRWIALAKATALAIVTALPFVPLTPLLAIPGGLLGVFIQGGVSERE